MFTLVYEKKKRLGINNRIWLIFFFTYFWPQGVSVILKVITAREKYFVCNGSTECQEISDHQLVYFVSDLLEDY